MRGLGLATAVARIAAAAAEGGRPAARASADALARIVPVDAWVLVSFDPLTSRHTPVAGAGYDQPETGASVFPRQPFFRRMVAARRPALLHDGACLRPDPAYVRDHLRPYGWRDGFTVPLVTGGGRYTGLLHVNTRLPEAYGEDTRALLGVLAPVLAPLADEGPSAAAGPPRDEGFRLLAFDVRGAGRPVPGRPVSPVLAAAPEVTRAAAAFLASGRPHLRRTWCDRSGVWRELRFARADGGGRRWAVVAERARPLPWRLTVREIEVLSLVAEGAGNPEIAARLGVSPRTATTHVYNAFAKLGLGSRAGAAAFAVEEGLVLLESPKARGPRRPDVGTA